MSETPNRTRPVLNRVIFALLTLVLGGLVGAFVWVCLLYTSPSPRD